MEKTRPAAELTEKERKAGPGQLKNWKVATYVSMVVIVGLILFNVLTRAGLSDELSAYGKSIAKLPFINDIPEHENTYFINGTMEAILNHLCVIKDLRVAARTSVESYRDAPKPVPEIS